MIGQTTPHFPLYLAEAAIVELVALRIGRGRPLTLGAVAGLLIGTVGFAAEYGWTHVVGYMPWPSSLITEGLACALVAGVGGGIIGGFIGRAVSGVPVIEQVPRWLVPAAGAAVIAVMTWSLPMPDPRAMPSARVTLTDVAGAAHREVRVTARLTPANAADGARWFVAAAWQGGGAVVARMQRIGPGVYRSAEPLPAWGPKWKSTLRLQTGRAVMGLPIYLPADAAIPVGAVAAPPHFTRAFVRDKRLLQREQKRDVPSFLQNAAYLAVLAIWTAMVAIVGWGLVRLTASADRTAPPPARRAAPATPGHPTTA